VNHYGWTPKGEAKLKMLEESKKPNSTQRAKIMQKYQNIVQELDKFCMWKRREGEQEGEAEGEEGEGEGQEKESSYRRIFSKRRGREGKGREEARFSLFHKNLVLFLF
jgi:hypothetical protein